MDAVRGPPQAGPPQVDSCGGPRPDIRPDIHPDADLNTFGHQQGMEHHRAWRYLGGTAHGLQNDTARESREDDKREDGRLIMSCGSRNLLIGVRVTTKCGLQT